MKIRSDFVTNSSSSSFVLAYKTKEDWNAFIKECKDNGFLEIADFLSSCKKRQPKDFTEKAREEIIAFVRLAQKRRWEDVYFEQHPCKYDEVDTVRKSEEFQNWIQEKMSDTNFEKKIKDVQDAEILLKETIWDSEGDLLFFAIRHGYLRETPARKHLVTQLDVG